ncbi:MAG: zf-HC2 domain-containing protein [Chloroflexi bacterium]|nr:zf-HC2 domain-containing protein [Chloroflexota bacterium]
MGIFSNIFKRKPEEVDCSDVQDLASDYVDEEMTESIVVKMRRHLSDCVPCQSFMTSFTNTIRALRSMPKEKASDEVRERILKQTRD